MHSAKSTVVGISCGHLGQVHSPAPSKSVYVGGGEGLGNTAPEWVGLKDGFLTGASSKMSPELPAVHS